MSFHIAALVLANLLMLALGCGLLPLLRLARTRRELIVRLPIAYAVGLAATGILAAELALLDVAVGPLALTLLAAGALALGLPGLPAGPPLRLRRPAASELPALLVLAVAAAYVIPATRLAVVRPLLASDGWENWGLRARALYALGRPAAPVFTDPSYPGLGQPLLLPGIEAVGFRFMGAFDGTLLHLQLVGFAVALVGGAWTLLRRSASPLLLAACLAAIVSAPAFLERLFADGAAVPLASFVALGVTSLAAWLRGGRPGFLPAATLFLGAATLTANAGELFALAAFLAAACVAGRSSLRPLAIAAGAVVAIAAPWRVWLLGHGVRLGESAVTRLFDPSYLSRHAGRVEPAAAALWHSLWRVQSWSYLAVLVLLGLAGAIVQRRGRLALFGTGWLVLSFAALLGLFWVSGEAPRAQLAGPTGSLGDCLLLAAGLLVPLLLYTGPEPELVAVAAGGPKSFGQIAASSRRLLRWLGFPRDPDAPESGSTPGRLPWKRPRRELLLLGLVAVATLTPVYPVDAQDVSRLCLTEALVHLQVSNDSCLSSPYAGDKSRYGGHLYSDKAPGMSVIELPSAVAVRLPSAQFWPFVGLRLWAVRALSSGLALLVCAFLVGRISEGLVPGYGGLSLVAFALGTLVAPLAAANFEHITAGTLGLAAFALAWRRRPLLAGLAAGAAVDVAYEAAIILVVLGVYVALRGRRSIVEYICGLVPGGLLLGVYDWVAFGAPWHLSYRYKTAALATQQAAGFFGIHAPYPHAVRLVFVGHGGLLILSPVLVAAGFGLVQLGRRFGAEAAVCAAVTLAFVLLNCSYFDPYGGIAPGPRFLVPALPFLALGLGPAFASARRLTLALAAASIAAMTAVTLTWTNGAFSGSNATIWRQLERFLSAPGSSWITQNLSSNVLTRIGPGLEGAAAIVALAAAAALILAFPASASRPGGATV